MPPFRAGAWVAGAFAVVIGLTLAVFLARAGAPFAQNWPASYHLTSSDNSILFQFVHDLLTGMTMDWSFSPQVYVFPEIPISLVAYLLAGGNLAWYFVVVALINNALLFAAIWWLTALLFGGSLPQQLLRAFIAAGTLILFPLLNTHWMYLFHLAPTYYFGMYLFGLLLPAALLSPKLWARILVLAGWMLAGAVSPLVTAMTLPGIAIVFLVTLLRHKWSRALWQPMAAVGIALVGVGLLRVLVFEKMAAATPLSYIGDNYAISRIVQVYDNFNGGFQRGFDPILYAISLASTAFTLVLLVVFVRRMFTRKSTGKTTRKHTGTGTDLARLQAGIYLTAFPVMGGIAMTAIFAIDFYYLWPMFVGSVVLSLLLLPEVIAFRERVVRIVAVCLAGAMALGAGVVIAQGDYSDNRYFGYRSALTKCLDEFVPGQVGYATFSDARSSALPSYSGVELIAVNAQLGPSFWLANRAQSREHTGTFVLINPQTTENPITKDAVTAKLGKPVAIYPCGAAEIWSYTK
jgi:hypothetical protein